MCGIAGWIDWKRDLRKQLPELRVMQETLVNRGPDAEGMWISPWAALVHRRLIVVDPRGGGQPMVRKRGKQRYILVYNGELYNTNELRRELEQRGHIFFGHSDTEVLLLSYIEWGERCLERLNGIFAFGIWDETEQSLFLARDRLGVKPLFYAERNGSFIFGSEIKTLLANPTIHPEVDSEGLAEIFVMGPARTPGHGIFRGIKELKPGYWLIYDRRGVRTSPYWRLESRPHPDDLETTAAKVRNLLQDAAERQLMADVPVCILLSGGLDSSAIAAFASEASSRSGTGTLNTYSVDYVDNNRFFRPNQFEAGADSPWVRRVSTFLKSNHHNIVIDTPDLVDALESALRARDLPGMADVDASLLLFCREIKKEATVALSGEAADEIFGGYPWFYNQESIANDGFPWIRMLPERMRLLSPDLVERIQPQEYLSARYREALAEVPHLEGEEAYEKRMRKLLYLNITRFMPILLDRKDRMSMATGLEVRVPYCDHRLVEYVWNIPWRMKTCGKMPKGILRRALRGILPDDVLNRRKSPYPKTHHPAFLEAVRSLALQVISDPNSPLLPLINREAVRQVILSSARDFNPAWFSQLMGGAQYLAYLVQVDMWLRDYHVVIV
ncbi:asparagine synthetase 3 [Thermacetogenium phaeum DSM 12270]|uniref:asparagine synthase (glutamine-hydrolyzing) n=1 Tax=Thermacetogenium phaeum (strain ATCC BAA-254 / DSM 26808 / PB) TaxID=1089553 RepID=K4LE01_THEPS|nr:asparagine synthase (glutamine-hydrolyzing) [Thermacetogenium phaeum]AFV11093.1 asparagine synthetase 3 [Thermacetogenium phaeum DSM 12270]